MSLAAKIAELCGDDLPGVDVPDIETALSRCPRKGVCPARGPDGEAVAVAVLEGGQAFVLPDRCPHAGAPLSDGFVDGNRLVCAHHGWEIDLPGGQVVGMPRRCVSARQIA